MWLVYIRHEMLTNVQLKRLFGVLIAVTLLPVVAAAQTDVEELGRRYGATPPPGYYETLRSRPSAFQFSRQNGWVVRGRRVAEVRNRARGRLSAGALDVLPRAMALTTGEPQMAPADAVVGDLNVPVFLVMYFDTDSASLAQNVPTAALRRRLYGTDPAPPYSVHTYYQELSNGALHVNGTVFPWASLAHAASQYEGDDNGLDSSGDIDGMIDEIIAIHDDTVDFGLFDNDGPDGVPNSGDDDGFVDAIVIIHPKVDGSCKNRNPAAATSIWAHRYSYSGWTGGGVAFTNDSARGADQVIRVNDYIIQGGQGGDDGCASNEPQAMGVVAHETGHLLGLPDLYDNVTGGTGIGRWGIMGSGNHRVPARPAHMSAWSKAEVGWVTEVLIDRDTVLDISPIINSDTSYILPIPDSDEYFILENRQPLGSDSALYSPGLLVWHADSALIRFRGNGVNFAQPYGMALVQADGQRDLEQGNNRGDSDDPFPGTRLVTTLGVCTNPSTQANNGRASLAIVENIEQLAPLGTIRAGIRFEKPGPLTANDWSTTDGVMGSFFFHQLTASGGVDCDFQWSLLSGTLPRGVELGTSGQLVGRMEETGEFVADFQVLSGTQADTSRVTWSISAPALVALDVAGHLLGSGSVLTNDELTYLDLQGNGNGSFDLGDFLGWIESTGGQVSAAEIANVLSRERP